MEPAILAEADAVGTRREPLRAGPFGEAALRLAALPRARIREKMRRCVSAPGPGETEPMRIVVPKEVVPGETRVALVPESVGRLAKAGQELQIESGAGERAGFPDDAYRQAGAIVAGDTRALYAAADVVMKVREPVAHPSLGAHEADLIRAGALLIAQLGRDPGSDAAKRLAARRV